MSEELIIEAYELLEKGKSYDSLNSGEKIKVDEVFGGKIEYERMLSLSDMALEEDEIIAPSMTTESSLMKEFSQKHSHDKSKNKAIGFSLSKLFSGQFFRIAVPSLIVLIGLTFFLNKQLEPVNDLAEAQTTEEVGSEKEDEIVKSLPPKLELSEDKDLIEKEFKSELQANGSADNVFIHDLNSENEIAFDVVEDEVDLEGVPTTDKGTDGLLIPTDAANYNNKFTQGDQSTIMSGSSQDYSYSPATNNMTFTWSDSTVTSIGTFTVQDPNAEMDELAEEPSPVVQKDIINIDNALGNMAPISSDIGYAEEERLESSAKNGKISTVSNALNDQSLFEFLYTTY